MKIEDLTDREFGKLKVIERDYNKTRGKTKYYKCECKCGNKYFITTEKELLSGKASCGCIQKEKGFNKYKINGNITELYITKRNGDELTALINTDDLQKLIDLNYSWYSKNDKYVIANLDHNKRNNIFPKTLYLHQCILDSPKDCDIDHKNHNGFDNRKSNLRVSQHYKNNRNRKGRNSNNKSGYRNVSWSSWKDKWVVQLQIHNKNTQLGYFDDVDEAGKYAEEMREKYYGEYKGLC